MSTGERIGNLDPEMVRRLLALLPETEAEIETPAPSAARETTTQALARLTPREERVLRLRFGIGMKTDHTLEEVGREFSLPPERIRWIEAKALRKLKHPSPSRKRRNSVG
jgi:RNA polymerase primary sigma factor